MKLELETNDIEWDDFISKELRDLYEGIKKDKRDWGKGWKKDLKAIARVHNLYSTPDRHIKKSDYKEAVSYKDILEWNYARKND